MKDGGVKIAYSVCKSSESVRQKIENERCAVVNEISCRRYKCYECYGYGRRFSFSSVSSFSFSIYIWLIVMVLVVNYIGFVARNMT